MIGDKKSYSCFKCGVSIVAEQTDSGTVPHVINPCVSARCDSLMKDDFETFGLVGKQVDYHLVRNPEAETGNCWASGFKTLW